MKITALETQLFNNSPNCIVHKYDFSSDLLGLITAEIDGRYPEDGMVLNEISDETYFVLSGSCKVHNETGDYELVEGDLFYFAKRMWYWIESEKVEVVVCTAPPWTEEQHRHIT